MRAKLSWSIVAVLLLAFVLIVICNSSRLRAATPVFNNVYATHTWGTDSGDALLQNAVNSFRQISGHTVLLEPDEFVTRSLEAQIKAGLGPDVIIGLPYEQIIPLADAGLLRPLDRNAIDGASYVPEHLDALTYQGHLYGLPFMATTDVLYYNKQQVAQPPDTLAELLDEADAGRAVAITSSFSGSFWGIAAFGGAVLARREEAQLTPASYAAWFNWLKNSQGLSGIVIDDNQEFLVEKFIQGDVSYLVASSEMLPSLTETLGAEVVGVAALPGAAAATGESAADDAETGPVLAGSAAPLFRLQVIAFNRAADPETIEMGLSLARFLNNATLQRKFVIEELGLAPTNLKVFVRPAVSESGNALLRQSRTAVTIPLEQLVAFNQMSEAANTLYLQVLEGGLDPDTAAAELTALIKQHLPSQP